MKQFHLFKHCMRSDLEITRLVRVLRYGSLLCSCLHRISLISSLLFTMTTHCSAKGAQLLPKEGPSSLDRSLKDESRNYSSTRIGNARFEPHQSTIPGVGLGFFTSKIYGVGEIIGHYYGTRDYDNLSIGSSNSCAVYGEGMMAVAVSSFMKWVFQLQIKALCPQTVWIYPPQAK